MYKLLCVVQFYVYVSSEICCENLFKMHVLWVLMWKHMTVRIRRFVVTPFELLSPCCFFILLFLIRNILNDPKIKEMASAPKTVHYTEAFPLEHTVVPPLILYSPDTPLVSSLMDEVGQKLKLYRLNSFPNRHSRGYYAFSNASSSALLDFIEEMKDDTAVVIFKDMEGDIWPNKLNYTIRMKEDFMTHIYESLDEETGYHQRFGAIYEPFMRLQWAIDSSYLKMISGNEVNQTITLQEFPFVDTRRNPSVAAVCAVLPAVCFMSLILPFVLLMSRLLEERASGVQELIKMVGVSNNILGLSNFLNAVPAGLVYCVIGTTLLKASDNPFLPLSNGFLIVVCLALHYCTIIALAFACSYIINNVQYSVSLATVSYLLLWIPTNSLQNWVKEVPPSLFVFTGLLPHQPMYWFWNEMKYHEMSGDGLSFSNFIHSYMKNSPSVLMSYIAAIVQIFLYFLLTWYLSMVRPGNYGVAQPWNFICQSSYWSKKKKVSPDQLSDESEAEPITKDPLYYENPPPNAEVGIRILNVSKIFDKNAALNNVSFDVYKGEITVLLGHNGAGKTTLMSIITGMYSATEGQIFVNGVDVAGDPFGVRKQFGLCTQHNLFFPDLTVYEHVMFFAMIKGSTFPEARKSAYELLDRLGLAEKVGSRSAELSGGMKRRLQLACALSGGSEVLILDEPTSGLDVETRRELWDLLLSLRGHRTVLLTTHFMEEADALGDRVAALLSGRLKCHATPMYLKKNIGTGYRLSLTTIGMPKSDDITKTVTSVVPDATIKEQSINTISYSLPANDSSKFPKLFTKLEDNRSELGIDSIGVGVSTLEEVFVKLCSDVTTSFAQDQVDGIAPEPTFERVTGLPLYIRQMLVLMKRQMKYLWWKKISFIVFQIVLPVSLICLFTITLNRDTATQSKNQSQSLDLNLYADMPERRVLFKVDNLPTLRSLSDTYNKVNFEPTDDVEKAILKIGEENLSDYNKYLVGVELNNTDAKVMYTTTVRHAAPVAMNVLSNMVAAQLIPWSDGRTITTYNHPFRGNTLPLQELLKMKEPKDSTDSSVWCVITVIMILSVLTSATNLAIKERMSSTRHIHVMSGCSPTTHWLTTLLTHTLIYTPAIIVPTIIATSLDQEDTLSQPSFLVALFLILVLGVMTFMSFVYLISFVMSERASGIFLIFVIIFGVFTSSSKTVAAQMDQKLGKWDVPITIAGVLVPVNTIAAAIMKALHVARVNMYCEWNRDKCPMILPLPGLMGFDLQKCCANENPLSYTDFSDIAPGKDILILVFQLIFFMGLVILTQYGLFNSMYDKVLNQNYKPPPARFNDEMVRAEKTYVDRGITLRGNNGPECKNCMEPELKTAITLLEHYGQPYCYVQKQGLTPDMIRDVNADKQVPDAMLVNNVHKNYLKICAKQRNINAVNGVSFSLKKGECFGLLGVNGAGKSTTFKMISAEECPTRGHIFSSGYHLKWPRGNYLQSLGYCPQFFGLDEFLTGRENLVLLLTLRGLNHRDVHAETEAWIEVVGLQKYKDKLVHGYSGGCMRRLATAAALGSGAPVALLDEPTSGVDVAARRRVWAALQRGLRQNRSVIITSHSMDEMETLCDRIGIMSGGELAALGSAAALRAQHTEGHAVLIKIKSAAAAAAAGDVTDTAATELQNLKEKFAHKFNCTLKDEHKTMLHYHINETMRYSQLFTAMEKLKASFPDLIEDYSVTETTLEEVFLSYAQPPPERTPNNV